MEVLVGDFIIFLGPGVTQIIVEGRNGGDRNNRFCISSSSSSNNNNNNNRSMVNQLHSMTQ